MYVLVEGEVGEKKVYREWIPLVNPNLNFAETLDDVKENNYFIIHGGGYPAYLETIENAINDIIQIKDENDKRIFDRLVIAADSEELSFEEKESEIKSHIENILKAKRIKIDYRIIIQHFCLETWCLGNRRIVGNNIQDKTLKSYIKHHDVSKNDPEDLLSPPELGITRAQFSEKYLRSLLQSKYKNLTYTKSKPSALLHEKYFEQLKSRLEDTSHIASFREFLKAFE